MKDESITKLEQIDEVKLASFFRKYTDDNQSLYGEFNFDLTYGDELSSDTVIDILASSEPETDINEMLDGRFLDDALRRQEALLHLVILDLKEEYPNLDLGDDLNQLNEIVWNIPCNFNPDYWLKQEYNTNIYLKDDSLLAGLDELSLASKNENLNELYILTKLSFKDLLELNALQKENNYLKEINLTLPRGATIGLTDITGDSKPISVESDSEILIPLDKIKSIMPDGFYKYDVGKFVQKKELWQSECSFRTDDRKVTVSNYLELLKAGLQKEFKEEMDSLGKTKKEIELNPLLVVSSKLLKQMPDTEIEKLRNVLIANDCKNDNSMFKFLNKAITTPNFNFENLKSKKHSKAKEEGREL